MTSIHIGKHSVYERVMWWGMGVGISNARLAGAIAHHGGIGTLSSAGLCLLPGYRHIYDQALQEARKYQKHIPLEIKQKIFEETNLTCIQLEVKKAKELADGHGLIFMNFLFALTWVEKQIKAACEAGVDGVTSGAGIAWNLPEITKDFPNVAIGIMLSDPKWVKIVIEKWMSKYNRAPDYIIFEAPGGVRGAGWHLGVRDMALIDDPRFALENSLPAARQWLDDNGHKDIKLIWAWGIVDHQDLRQVLAYGADMGQVGSRFLASIESGAHQNFKDAVVQSTKEDIITYMSSVGLLARALRQSPILTEMQWIVASQKPCSKNCLKSCGRRDGDQARAQMCLAEELVKSTEWSSWDGLMFVGESVARIDNILSVEAIMDILTR